MHPPTTHKQSFSPSLFPRLLGGAALILIFAVLLIVRSRRHEAQAATSEAPGSTSARSNYHNRALLPRAAPADPSLSMPTISGTVYGIDGRAIAGATIAASTFQVAGNLPTTAGSVESDEQGRFQLRVADGTYYLTSSKDGYGPSTATANSGDKVSLVLPNSGVVEGHVHDERGEPVKDFYLDVLALSPQDVPAQPPLWSKRVIHKDGYFRIAELPPWAVNIRASAVAYASAVAPLARVEPGNTQTLDLTLSAGCTLEGRVEDERGQPLGYVFVDAESSLGASAMGELSVDAAKQTQSDEDGHFRLENVPTGSVIIRGYEGGSAVTTVQKEIPSCDRVEPVKLVMSAGGGITGVAKLGNGTPLAGVRITAMHRATGFVNTVTDAQGRFAFDKLPASTVRLDVEHEGQHLTVFVEVKTGEVIERNIALPSRGDGTLRGRITAGDKPLAGMQVMVLSNQPAEQGMNIYYPVTDATGAYDLPRLPEGPYMARVVTASQTGRVQIEAGKVATLDFDLSKPVPSAPAQ